MIYVTLSANQRRRIAESLLQRFANTPTRLAIS